MQAEGQILWIAEDEAGQDQVAQALVRACGSRFILHRITVGDDMLQIFRSQKSGANEAGCSAGIGYEAIFVSGRRALEWGRAAAEAGCPTPLILLVDEEGPRPAEAAATGFFTCLPPGELTPLVLELALRGAAAEREAGQSAFVVQGGEYKTERRRSEELSTLNRIGQLITSSLDLDEVLKRVMGETRALLRAEAASVLLLDLATDELYFAAAAGPGSESLSGVRMPATAGIAGHVLHERTPALVGDVQQDARFYEQIDLQSGKTTRTLLVVPLCYQEKATGVIEVMNKEQGPFNTHDQDLLFALAGTAAIAIENARLYNQAQAGQERLKALSRRLVVVQEDERRRLALELHDEIGQELTGIRLLLHRAARSPEGQMKDQVNEAYSLVNELLAQVRELSLQLRPSMLDDFGLLPALHWLFERYEGQTQVKVNFTHTGLVGRFASELETAVYRILQEALTNVARYAQVNLVDVRLWASANALGLRVEDAGVGFQPERFPAGVSSGLDGMRERAGLLGGRFMLQSAPSLGTCVEVVFPFDAPRYSTENIHDHSNIAG